MKSLKERFEDKYIPEPNSGCWLWTGSLTRGGYGHIRDMVGDNWGMRRAHRVSYELNKGDIPQGKVIMHTCDNPLCVNPSHLKVGTNLENTRDKVSKGRHSWGIKDGHNKLNLRLANHIREYYKSYEAEYKHIAIIFGTSTQQVCRIINNQIWRSSVKEG